MSKSVNRQINRGRKSNCLGGDGEEGNFSGLMFNKCVEISMNCAEVEMLASQARKPGFYPTVWHLGRIYSIIVSTQLKSSDKN